MDASARPTVSIILPTFNRLRFLRPAVESVFAQTFADWELVIADDGSDEPTRAYLGAIHRPPRVRVLLCAHTGSPGRVRNAALREATGTYVAFLDSDDLWLARKLELQLRTLRSRPRCRWSYTAFTQVDGENAVLPEEARRLWVPNEGAVFETIVAGKVSLRSPSLVVAERELVREAGGFDEKMNSAEDMDLWARLAQRSELALIDEPLARIRVHEDNYSSQDLPAGLAGWGYVLKKLEDTSEPRLRPLLRRERVRMAVGLAWTYAVMGSRANVLRTVCRSFPFSWRYARWWWGSAKALVRPFIPGRLLALRRRRCSQELERHPSALANTPAQAQRTP
jgi:glycosyltransferase involved in cell wall biosynthesis